MPKRPANPDDHHLKRRKGGAYVCQLGVPERLQARAGRKVLERYLGTSDLRVARRKRDHALAELRRYLEGLEREEAAVGEAVDAIRIGEQYATHQRMLADPHDAWERTLQQLGAFDFDQQVREALEAVGLPRDVRHMAMARQAVADGMGGALVLWERGLTPPEPKSHRYAREASSGGPTLGELADGYEKATGTGTTDKSRKQAAKSVRMLASCVGDRSARDVSGREVQKFVDALGRIDPEYRRNPKAADMALAELEREHPGEGLSAATVNRHLSNIAGALKWAAKRYEWEGWASPTAGRSVRAGEGDAEGSWGPLTDGEVFALLDGLEPPEKPARGFGEGVYWAVLIGAYAGLRAGEIADLTGNDVERTEDGATVFRVKDRARGKTASARRLVPVHPELVDRGLLDYAAKCGEARLIGCDANTLAKRFPAFRRDRKVDREGVAFHSLRKSFTTKLERLDVPSDTAALLLGHKGLRSFTYGRYSGGHAPAKLAEVVAGVRYEPGTPETEAGEEGRHAAE